MDIFQCNFGWWFQRFIFFRWLNHCSRPRLDSLLVAKAHLDATAAVMAVFVCFSGRSEAKLRGLIWKLGLQIWSGWWWLEHGFYIFYDFPIILGIIIITTVTHSLTPSFFRGVGGSTTNQWRMIIIFLPISFFWRPKWIENRLQPGRHDWATPVEWLGDIHIPC